MIGSEMETANTLAAPRERGIHSLSVPSLSLDRCSKLPEPNKAESVAASRRSILVRTMQQLVRWGHVRKLLETRFGFAAAVPVSRRSERAQASGSLRGPFRYGETRRGSQRVLRDPGAIQAHWGGAPHLGFGARSNWKKLITASRSLLGHNKDLAAPC